MENLLSIENRLSNIEKLLLSKKEVLTFDEFCTYCGISKSYGYKLTSGNFVPHYKPQKMVYFNLDEVNIWLQRNPVKTKEQIKKEIESTVVLKGGSK